MAVRIRMAAVCAEPAVIERLKIEEKGGADKKIMSRLNRNLTINIYLNILECVSPMPSN